MEDSFTSNIPPFETMSLRKELTAFLDTVVANTITGEIINVGNYQWGVYTFYDYDREPIYVGQTKESLRTRIRRHLTNQRTDAVAMNVLDPFEVHTVRVWPLPQFQGCSKTKDNVAFRKATQTLDALERAIYDNALQASRFGAVLNEKDPPETLIAVEIPEHYDRCIVSSAVYERRKHPDIRIARRSQVISRLAQVIEERKVTTGLRRVLATQAKRLSWLAMERLKGIQTES